MFKGTIASTDNRYNAFDLYLIDTIVSVGYKTYNGQNQLIAVSYTASITIHGVMLWLINLFVKGTTILNFQHERIFMEIQKTFEGAILDAPSVAFAQAARADCSIILSVEERIEAARANRAIMFEAMKASLSLALQGNPKEWQNLVGEGFAVANQGTLRTLLSAKTAEGKALKSLLSSPKTGYRIKYGILSESTKIEEAKAVINSLLNPFEVRVRTSPKGEIEKMLLDLNRVANRLKTISPADSLMVSNINKYISFYKDMVEEEKNLGT